MNIEKLKKDLCSSDWENKEDVCGRLHELSLDIALMQGYTNVFSKPLNSRLGSEVQSSPDARLAQRLADLLDSFLSDNCSKHSGKLLFHDPKQFDARIWCQQYIGEVLEFPYFLSTSAEEKNNGEGYLKFIIEPSTNCAGFDIQKWSTRPSELEVLFPRHSKFEIIRTEVNKDREFAYLKETDKASTRVIYWNTQYYEKRQNNGKLNLTELGII